VVKLFVLTGDRKSGQLLAFGDQPRADVLEVQDGVAATYYKFVLGWCWLIFFLFVLIWLVGL
jgi:hypothetical protein